MKNIELLDGAMGSEFIKRGISLPNHIWSAHLNLEASEIHGFPCNFYAKTDPDAVSDLGGGLSWVVVFKLGREVAPAQKTQKSVGVGV